MGIALNVLILEDEEADAELMVEELRRAGFDPEVMRVDNEVDFGIGLERGPDVILADYRLPRYDAMAALTLVRDRRLDVPFIIVSGAISEEAAVEAMKRGAADYLLKDRPARLGAAVRQALEARRVRAQRRVAAQALRISEARYRSLTDDVLDNSSVGLFILDADLTVVWVNKAAQRFFGISREAVLGKEQRWLVRTHLAAATENPGEFARALAATYDDNTYTETFECHIVPGPGVGGAPARRERWLEHVSHPITAGLYKGGRIEHYSDITERKRAELRRDQLLAQLDRRVRDLIHDVAAAAEREAEGASSLEEFRGRFSERLGAIARMYELLAESRSRGADVREVVARTIAAATPDARASTFQGEGVHLPGEAASALGLALHDLAAGAVSRGAFAGGSARVEVKWDRRKSSAGGDVLHLIWAETGAPAEEPGGDEARRAQVAADMPGDVQVRRDRGRAVFEIVVPLGPEPAGATNHV